MTTSTSAAVMIPQVISSKSMDGINHLAIPSRHRSGRGLLRVRCGAVGRKTESDYISVRELQAEYSISFTLNWLGIANSASLILGKN
jgi:hypothetical protein